MIKEKDKFTTTEKNAHSVRVTYHVPHDEMSEVIKDCLKLSSDSSIYIDEGNKRKQNILVEKSTVSDQVAGVYVKENDQSTTKVDIIKKQDLITKILIEK